MKGDIVQVGETDSDPSLHTFIIVGSLSGNTFQVVDSNHENDGIVREYNRTFSLGNDERAYRMGSLKAQASPSFAPADSDGDGLPDGQDRCPFLPGPTVNDGCPVDGREVGQQIKGDFNGDGKSDVAILGQPSSGSADLQVFLSTGSTFQLPQQWWYGPSWGWTGMKVVAADFNGDGKTDIASLGTPGDGSDLQVFLSTGSGFLAPQQWWHGIGWNWNGMKVVAGDFNGDSKADIASLGLPGDGSDLQVLLSSGSSFVSPQQWWHGAGWAWANAKVTAGDFNGDGKTDVAILGIPTNGSSDLEVFLSTGGSFVWPQQWWFGNGWNWMGMQIVSGDFNGDGKADIASLGTPGDGADVQVFLSLGSGFQPPQQWWHGIGWNPTGMKPVVGDFSGDGLADLATLGQPGDGSDLQVFISGGANFQLPQQWWHGVGWNWNWMKVA